MLQPTVFRQAPSQETRAGTKTVPCDPRLHSRFLQPQSDAIIILQTVHARTSDLIIQAVVGGKIAIHTIR